MIPISQEVLVVFGWLIRSSFQAMILLVLILLIRIAVKGRLSVRMVYWLWILLLLRLVWPLNLQATFSVFNLIPQFAASGPYSVQTAEEEQGVSLHTPGLSQPTTRVAPSFADAANLKNTEASEADQSAGTRLPAAGLLCLVWLWGAGLLAVWVLWNNYRLWRIIRRERLVTNEAMLELLEDCKMQVGLQTVVGIVETDRVSTPCLFGYLRPRLLLPIGTLDELSGEQLRYVFMHELAHLKRHDILVGWLMAVVQVLHWFNPAVWYAMAKISTDRELACDEAVLSYLGENASKAYGSTLLKYLECFSRQQKVPAMAGIAEHQSLLKRRLTMIAQFKNTKQSCVPFLAILALLAGTTFTAARSRAAEPTSAVSSVGTVQTNSVQAMIDAASAGSTLVIPEGFYTEPITINKSLTIQGDKCIFEVTADCPAILINAPGKAVSVAGFTIRWQLATSAEHEYPYAVAVKDTTAVIQNCVFRPLGNPQRSPVAVRSVGFSEMTLKDCDFEGFDYVVCYGEGTRGTMEGCFVRNCGHQGVILYSGAEADVTGNIFSASKFHAVRSTGGTLRMRNNLVINNKNRGVYLGNKSCSGTIENNVLIANGTGIDGISGCQFEIRNNVILNSGYAGISAIPQAKLKIGGNVLKNNMRGVVIQKKEGQQDPVQSEIGANVFWHNKTELENCQCPQAVQQTPEFKDAANGNFALEGQIFEQMGLDDPQKLVLLWEKYKGHEAI